MKKAITVLSFIILSFVNALRADFCYTDFGSTNGLALIANSSQYQNRLRLTPADSWQTGAVWSYSKQSIEAGFETSFTFQMSNYGGSPADGFAFVIQNNNPSAIGLAGFNLGYGGINNNIAIEFDTYKNVSTGYDIYGDARLYHNNDPSGNHVSVQVIRANSLQTDITNSLGYTSNIPNLWEGVHSVDIKYVDNVLTVTLDNGDLPLLSVPMTISSFMNCDTGTAWVGFTASTGMPAGQNHDILNWSFTEVPEPTTIALLGLGGLLLRRKK